MRLALAGCLHVPVDQDDVDAGCCRDVSDRSAHETGANDADLLDLGLRLTCRATGALVQLLHRDEERADHREGLGGLQDLCEVTLLYLESCIEGNLQAFIDAFQDGKRCRIVAGGFAA